MRALLTLLLCLGAMPPAGAQDPAGREISRRIDETIARFKKKREAAAAGIFEIEDAEQRLAATRALPSHADCCRKLWKIIEAHRGSKENLRGIAWIARYGTPADKRRALEMLIARHPKAPELHDACRGLLTVKPTRENRALLKRLIAVSPHRNVRGLATYVLATISRGLSRSAKGEEAATLAAESVRLLETVVARYASVEHRHAPLGDAARGLLFEIRHLEIGMKAPEISGRDMQGVALSLSEHRGRVVLLDYWGHW